MTALEATLESALESALEERPQTAVEEVANSVSHGVGLLGALAAVPVLVAATTSRHGHAGHIVGVSVFSATMVLLYLCSMLYHAMPAGRAKKLWVRLDHIAIFLFIAGSYTPFAIGALEGASGWALFGLVWGMAMVGAALKALNRLSNPLLSTGLYVAMGWLVLIAAYPLLQRVPPSGIAWLLGGGAAYTVGVIFFMLDSKLRFGHLVWHLFVLAGSTCHFFAVLWYSA